MPESAQQAAQPQHAALKETITSLIIAFVFAFVFRGFVIEAFVIPTGSMAPTLMGKHMRFDSPESGASWTVDTWDRNSAEIPMPVQGTRQPISATDPMTGAQIGQQLPIGMGENVDTLSGDRIFVLKYLYSIYDPARYDVVVFKYPGRPSSDTLVGQQENYIKRLIGLPGEEVALVDGDVFVRTATDAAGSRSDWNAENWRIARKSERVQRALWQQVYSSEFAALDPDRDMRRWFDSPWEGKRPDGETDARWDIQDRTNYVFDSAEPTSLVWNSEDRPIHDAYPYNERRTQVPAYYPVSDIRLAMGVEPSEDGLELAAVLAARGHEFSAEIVGETVTIAMRPMPALGSNADPGAWRTLEETTTRRTIDAGKVTNVEFWHVDQTVQVWIEGKRVAMAEYEWTPALRVEHATGRDTDDLLGPSVRGNPLANTGLYRAPEVRWDLKGSPVTLYRVRLDRDLYYQPGEYASSNRSRHSRHGQATLGTHPSQPNILGPDQFFTCGDNSPNSLDGRAWDAPDPWVGEQIDPTPGVVPRDLLIGKAFFVYFPSLHKDRPAPVPDVGRMRFIW